MARLEDVPKEELWQLLDQIDNSVPTQRVLAAIATKQGDSTSRLADRHDVSQQTIRNWLSRFEDRPLDEAPFDDSRAGRPRKPTEEEQERLMDEPENRRNRSASTARRGFHDWSITTSRASTAWSTRSDTSGD